MAVALYARVSTARQAEKDLSIPDQIRQMRDWCEANGHAATVEYIEPGASATDDRRPVFQSMISDATMSPSPFEAIIVHSLSRFFRNSLKFGLYERQLDKAGVKLISITQQTSDDPSGEMARKIFSVFDEYQSKSNGMNTLRAMKLNAEKGFFNGAQPPYGYRTIEAEEKGRHGTKKRLVVDPSEAATVKLIFRLYVDGLHGTRMSIRSIAGHLNKRNISKRGHTWSKSAVGLALANPLYKGEYYFNRHDSKNKRTKPKEEWIKVEVEPIVDTETFERANALSTSRSPQNEPPGRAASPTLLTGVLKCGQCGSAMTLATGKGGRYKYYKCTMRINRGSSHCDGPNIPMEKLDTLVIERLAERVITPKRIQLILKQLKADMKEARNDESSALLELQTEMKGIETKRNRLYEAVEAGVLPLDGDLTDRVQKLKARRQEVLIEMGRIRQRQDIPLNTLSPKHIEAFSKSLRNKLFNQSARFGKGYLRLLVDEVRINGNEAVMKGSHAAMANALMGTKTGPHGRVPRFVPEWLPGQDSNLRQGD